MNDDDDDDDSDEDDSEDEDLSPEDDDDVSNLWVLLCIIVEDCSILTVVQWPVIGFF